VALDMQQQQKEWKPKRPEQSTTPEGFRCGVKIYEIRSARGQELSTVVPPLGNLSVRTSLWMDEDDFHTAEDIGTSSLTFFPSFWWCGVGGCVSAASFLLRFQRQPPDSAGLRGFQSWSATQWRAFSSTTETESVGYHFHGEYNFDFSHSSFVRWSVGHLAATNGVIFGQ
jgi:hypothetical protein